VTSPGRRDALVLWFFVAFFALFASGRLASSDAGEQLRAAVLLAGTGSPGADVAPAGGWVHAPNGRYYEPHDLGNLLLMLPAAKLAAVVSPAPIANQIAYPPVIARVLVSLECALLAALACTWLYKLLVFYVPPRTAFLMALAFPSATIFFAYARAAWDVLGACAMMCGALYYSVAYLRGRAPEWNAIMLAGTLGAAFTFRYSLAPFLAPAAVYILWSGRGQSTRRAAVAAGVVFTLILMPTFAYNFIRTGSMLRPATASAEYIRGANALTGSLAHGAYGLLISPNRGLFVFSPVLLAALTVPFVAARLLPEQRVLVVAYGLGALGYFLLIAKMVSWGVFGWGPRYLVPILPILFVMTCFTALAVRRPARRLICAAAVLSAVMTFPTAVVNWHLATTTWPEALDPDARLPYQQLSAWRTLRLGLKGQSLPVPSDAADDPLRATSAQFPDLLAARLARRFLAHD
jgi:hypothetical protein